MRASPIFPFDSSYLPFLQITATATAASHSPTRFLVTPTNQRIYQSLLTVSPKFGFSQFTLDPSNCFNSDSSVLDTTDNNGGGDDDDDDYVLLEKGSEWLSEDGVYIEIKKLGKNSRRIRSKIEVDASLDAVWNILTDYANLADFFPNLAVSELVEKKDNAVRLYQIGQQNLGFGLKFKAKGVLDCYEKDLEICPAGKKRNIEFKMIEGDFQLFEGKWSIEQPKFWLPVRLVEYRLCKEIKGNLSCIREAVKKVIN